MTEQELFDLARSLQDEPEHQTLKSALETIWGHGFADESAGSITEAPMTHVFRVNRWLLWTDSQGNTEPEEYATEERAQRAFDHFESSADPENGAPFYDYQ